MSKQNALVLGGISVIFITGGVLLQGKIFHHTHTYNGAEIARQYSRVQVPNVFILESSSNSDAVPEDPSLPAQASYTYTIAEKNNFSQKLTMFRDALIHEGYTATAVQKYAYPEQVSYKFTANNKDIYIAADITSSTDKSNKVLTPPSDEKLEVQVFQNDK